MDQEIAPGVIIAHGGDCPGIYINDDEGEVVMWIYDEIVEDHLAWTASMHAVAMAAKEGPAAVRKFLNR